MHACMVCIEGGVITALHHQITNPTHTRYTKRDAREKKSFRYIIHLILKVLKVKCMIKSIFIAAHSTTSHWKQLVHSCFQRGAVPRKTACYVSSANCGSFNATSLHCRAPYATTPPILVQLRWFQGIPGQCPSLLSTPHRGS